MSDIQQDATCCTCGHLRDAHADSGHGECDAWDGDLSLWPCPCERYEDATND